MLEQFKTEYINKVLNGNGFDDKLKKKNQPIFIYSDRYMAGTVPLGPWLKIDISFLADDA